MPKVSVVIPTYNRAHLIGETIRSVLDQTYRDFEVIVIDDGSTDNTCDIVSAFSVRYHQQVNLGAPAARNKGIELSSGEYVAFLDSDDVLLRRALERGIFILDSYPEAGFSYGQAYLVDEKGRIVGLKKSSFLDRSCIVDGKELVKETLSTYRATLSAVMVRRSCLDKVGGFKEVMQNFAEDLDLIVRLAKRYSAAYIAEPLVNYRVHPGSVSRNVDPKAAERAYHLILKEIFEDAAISPYFEPWRSRAYSNYYRIIASYAYGKDMKLVRHYLGKALVVRPGSLLHKEGLSTAFIYAKSFLPRRFRLGLRHIKSHLVCSHQHVTE